MQFSSEKIKAVLRQNGYKATPQRLAVIKEFAQNNEFLTPAELYEKIRKNHPKIGMVTVYRVLDILDELGFTCKVHAGGDCNKYKINTEDHHHHLLCSNCGVVVNYNCDEAYFENLKTVITAETGFKVKEHFLEFTGLCPDCNVKTPPKSNSITDKVLLND
ncbi:MAG: Fur family transcriptional regulator [Dehalococcoidales bacterium]